ncbi:hypothetical protein CBW58_00100 [Yersinia frederiksenii]|nr:hypothetical protein CBW58_00100 [Yersinia frederiksenii]
MKILFYIEPLVELEKPQMKIGWSNHHAYSMIKSLINSGINGSDIAIIVGDSIVAETKALFSDIKIGCLSHIEYLNIVGSNSLDISIGKYRDTIEQNILISLSNKIKSSVLGFTPSVIITWSPIPEVKAAWPDIPILSWEYGMFSRAPYPETGYFDLQGYFLNSSLTLYEKEIAAWSASDKELKLVSTIREIYKSKFFNNSSILYRTLKPFTSMFDRCILLALQFSNFYAYDCHAKYQSQYDLLIATLEATPKNIGVIVTEHPEHFLFDDNTLLYLRNKYPNFIWDNMLRTTYASSQNVLSLVDTVVTVSSSIGLQATLWGKKLIVVGSSHLNLVADSHDLSDINSSITSSCYKDNIVAWLLTRYYIPWDILFSEDFLKRFLEKVILSYNNYSFEWLSSVYSLDIDELSQVYLNSRRSVLSRGDRGTISLYISYNGSDFCEENKLSYQIGNNNNIISELSNKLGHINRIRLDPTDKEDILFIRALNFFDHNHDLIFSWNGVNHSSMSSNTIVHEVDDTGFIIFCLDNDPWITFDSLNDICSVELEMRHATLMEIRNGFFRIANQNINFAVLSDLIKMKSQAVLSNLNKEDLTLSEMYMLISSVAYHEKF